MFLDKFKETPKDKTLYIMVVGGLIIVLLIQILVFMPIEASVSTYGILAFEFAWTQEKVEQIFSVWGMRGISLETSAIYWDFLYIVGYVSIAFGLIILVLRRAEDKLQKLGIFITITPFLTGIFDIIENINLLIMTDSPHSVSTINAFTASVSATIKFISLFTAIIYFVIALILVIIKKFRD